MTIAPRPGIASAHAHDADLLLHFNELLWEAENKIDDLASGWPQIGPVTLEDMREELRALRGQLPQASATDVRLRFVLGEPTATDQIARLRNSVCQRRSQLHTESRKAGQRGSYHRNRDLRRSRVETQNADKLLNAAHLADGLVLRLEEVLDSEQDWRTLAWAYLVLCPADVADGVRADARSLTAMARALSAARLVWFHGSMPANQHARANAVKVAVQLLKNGFDRPPADVARTAAAIAADM